ncbi:MAG: transposase [Rhizomicrobium sp.]
MSITLGPGTGWVRPGADRRRRWSNEEKDRILAEAPAPVKAVSAVARRYGMFPQQLLAGSVWPGPGALRCPRKASATLCR